MPPRTLSNNLLGRKIIPKPGYGNPAVAEYPNYRFWAGMSPNLSGEYVATIDAAWTEEGSVRVAAHDPFGNVGYFSLTLVNLKE